MSEEAAVVTEDLQAPAGVLQNQTNKQTKNTHKAYMSKVTTLKTTHTCLEVTLKHWQTAERGWKTLKSDNIFST